MTPTHSLMFLLLVILLAFHDAHADNSDEITLHNDETVTDLSVVRNWTLICQHLCGLNLSGPGCGSDCVPVDQQNVSEEDLEDNELRPDHLSELCDTLCESELGENRCECLVKIQPAASSKPPSPSRNKVCSDFCRFHQVTLRGCSKCPFEKEKNRNPLRNNVGNGEHQSSGGTSRESQASLLTLQQMPPVSAIGNSIELNIQTSTSETTPDWNRLCAQLCRQGNGGLLCNCDLAPF